MCGMKNHVSPENFSFISFPGHRLRDEPEDFDYSAVSKFTGDEGAPLADGVFSSSGESEFEWKLEAPSTYLADRESDVLEIYDIAELYEACARRAECQPLLNGTSSYRSSLWRVGPSLAHDGLNDFMFNSFYAGMVPSAVLHSIANAIVDGFTLGYIGRAHACDFLDPGVDVPDRLEGSPVTVMCVNPSVHTLEYLDGSSGYTPSKPSKDVTESQWISDFTPGKMIAQSPFALISTADVPHVSLDNVSKTVNIPKSVDSDRSPDPVLAPKHRICGTTERKPIPYDVPSGSVDLHVEGLPPTVIPGYGPGVSRVVSSDNSVLPYPSRTFYGASYDPPPDDVGGYTYNVPAGFVAPERIGIKRAVEDLGLYRTQGGVTHGVGGYLDDLASAFYPDGEAAVSYGFSVLVSKLTYSPSGYYSYSLGCFPRSQLPKTAFPTRDEIHGRDGGGESGDAQDTPFLDAALETWVTNSPAMTFPAFDCKFPPPVGWTRSEKSEKRHSDAPYYDLAPEYDKSTVGETASNFDARSLHVPIELRKEVLKSAGGLLDRLTRTLARVNSVECLCENVSSVTTTRTKNENGKQTEKTETTVKTTYAAENGGPFVIDLVGGESVRFQGYVSPVISGKRHSLVYGYSSYLDDGMKEPVVTEDTTEVTYEDVGTYSYKLYDFRVVRPSALSDEDPVVNVLTVETTVDGKTTVKTTKFRATSRRRSVFEGVPSGLVKGASLYAFVQFTVTLSPGLASDKVSEKSVLSVKTTTTSEGSGSTETEESGHYRSTTVTTSCDANHYGYRWVDYKFVKLASKGPDASEFSGTFNPYDYVDLKSVKVKFSDDWTEDIVTAAGCPGPSGVSDKIESSSATTTFSVERGKGSPKTTTTTRTEESSSHDKNFSSNISLSVAFLKMYLVIDWDFEADVKFELDGQNEAEMTSA